MRAHRKGGGALFASARSCKIGSISGDAALAGGSCTPGCSCAGIPCACYTAPYGPRESIAIKGLQMYER